MSGRVDQFCDKLSDKLDRTVGRVNDLKAKIQSDGEAGRAALDKEVDAAKAARRKVKDDADAARARMKQRQKKKKAETEDAIAQWKRKGEVDKLERRAEDAEAYAAWSVMVAAEAMDEAHLAIMQAIAARLDLDMAGS